MANRLGSTPGIQVFAGPSNRGTIESLENWRKPGSTPPHIESAVRGYRHMSDDAIMRCKLMTLARRQCRWWPIVL